MITCDLLCALSLVLQLIHYGSNPVVLHHIWEKASGLLYPSRSQADLGGRVQRGSNWESNSNGRSVGIASAHRCNELPSSLCRPSHPSVDLAPQQQRRRPRSRSQCRFAEEDEWHRGERRWRLGASGAEHCCMCCVYDACSSSVEYADPCERDCSCELAG